jgi:hypothetical protein
VRRASTQLGSLEKPLKEREDEDENELVRDDDLEMQC